MTNKICRICLGREPESYYELYYGHPTWKTKILAVVPEMNLDFVKEPIICDTCSREVNRAYQLKELCLHTEHRLCTYTNDIPNTYTNIYMMINEVNIPNKQIAYHNVTDTKNNFTVVIGVELDSYEEAEESSSILSRALGNPLNQSETLNSIETTSNILLDQNETSNNSLNVNEITNSSLNELNDTDTVMPDDSLLEKVHEEDVQEGNAPIATVSKSTKDRQYGGDCPICNRSFQRLKAHISKKHGKRRDCITCKRFFFTRDGYIRHMRIHDADLEHVNLQIKSEDMSNSDIYDILGVTNRSNASITTYSEEHAKIKKKTDEVILQKDRTVLRVSLTRMEAIERILDPVEPPQSIVGCDSIRECSPVYDVKPQLSAISPLRNCVDVSPQADSQNYPEPPTLEPALEEFRNLQQTVSPDISVLWEESELEEFTPITLEPELGEITPISVEEESTELQVVRSINIPRLAPITSETAPVTLEEESTELQVVRPIIPIKIPRLAPITSETAPVTLEEESTELQVVGPVKKTPIVWVSKLQSIKTVVIPPPKKKPSVKYPMKGALDLNLNDVTEIIGGVYDKCIRCKAKFRGTELYYHMKTCKFDNNCPTCRTKFWNPVLYINHAKEIHKSGNSLAFISVEYLKATEEFKPRLHYRCNLCKTSGFTVDTGHFYSRSHIGNLMCALKIGATSLRRCCPDAQPSILHIFGEHMIEKAICCPVCAVLYLNVRTFVIHFKQCYSQANVQDRDTCNVCQICKGVFVDFDQFIEHYISHEHITKEVFHRLQGETPRKLIEQYVNQLPQFPDETHDSVTQRFCTCGLRFNDVDMFQHQHKCSRMNWKSCMRCCHEFSRADLPMHKVLAHKMKIYHCTFCYILFDDVEKLARHTTFHHKDPGLVKKGDIPQLVDTSGSSGTTENFTEIFREHSYSCSKVPKATLLNKSTVVSEKAPVLIEQPLPTSTNSTPKTITTMPSTNVESTISKTVLPETLTTETVINYSIVEFINESEKDKHISTYETIISRLDNSGVKYLALHDSLLRMYGVYLCSHSDIDDADLFLQTEKNIHFAVMIFFSLRQCSTLKLSDFLNYFTVKSLDTIIEIAVSKSIDEDIFSSISNIIRFKRIITQCALLIKGNDTTSRLEISSFSDRFHVMYCISFARIFSDPTVDVAMLTESLRTVFAMIQAVMNSTKTNSRTMAECIELELALFNGTTPTIVRCCNMSSTPFSVKKHPVKYSKLTVVQSVLVSSGRFPNCAVRVANDGFDSPFFLTVNENHQKRIEWHRRHFRTQGTESGEASMVMADTSPLQCSELKFILSHREKFKVYIRMISELIFLDHAEISNLRSKLCWYPGIIKEYITQLDNADIIELVHFLRHYELVKVAVDANAQLTPSNDYNITKLITLNYNSKLFTNPFDLNIDDILSAEYKNTPEIVPEVSETELIQESSEDLSLASTSARTIPLKLLPVPLDTSRVDQNVPRIRHNPVIRFIKTLTALNLFVNTKIAEIIRKLEFTKFQTRYWTSFLLYAQLQIILYNDVKGDIIQHLRISDFNRICNKRISCLQNHFPKKYTTRELTNFRPVQSILLTQSHVKNINTILKYRSVANIATTNPYVFSCGEKSTLNVSLLKTTLEKYCYPFADHFTYSGLKMYVPIIVQLLDCNMGELKSINSHYGHEGYLVTATLVESIYKHYEEIRKWDNRPTKVMQEMVVNTESVMEEPSPLKQISPVESLESVSPESSVKPVIPRKELPTQPKSLLKPAPPTIQLQLVKTISPVKPTPPAKLVSPDKSVAPIKLVPLEKLVPPVESVPPIKPLIFCRNFETLREKPNMLKLNTEVNKEVRTYSSNKVNTEKPPFKSSPDQSVMLCIIAGNLLTPQMKRDAKLITAPPEVLDNEIICISDDDSNEAPQQPPQSHILNVDLKNIDFGNLLDTTNDAQISGDSVRDFLSEMAGNSNDLLEVLREEDISSHLLDETLSTKESSKIDDNNKSTKDNQSDIIHEIEEIDDNRDNDYEVDALFDKVPENTTIDCFEIDEDTEDTATVTKKAALKNNVTEELATSEHDDIDFDHPRLTNNESVNQVNKKVENIQSNLLVEKNNTLIDSNECSTSELLKEPNNTKELGSEKEVVETSDLLIEEKSSNNTDTSSDTIPEDCPLEEAPSNVINENITTTSNLCTTAEENSLENHFSDSDKTILNSSRESTPNYTRSAIEIDDTVASDDSSETIITSNTERIQAGIDVITKEQSTKNDFEAILKSVVSQSNIEKTVVVEKDMSSVKEVIRETNDETRIAQSTRRSKRRCRRNSNPTFDDMWMIPIDDALDHDPIEDDKLPFGTRRKRSRSVGVRVRATTPYDSKLLAKDNEQPIVKTCEERKKRARRNSEHDVIQREETDFDDPRFRVTRSSHASLLLVKEIESSLEITDMKDDLGQVNKKVGNIIENSDANKSVLCKRPSRSDSTEVVNRRSRRRALSKSSDTSIESHDKVRDTSNEQKESESKSDKRRKPAEFKKSIVDNTAALPCKEVEKLTETTSTIEENDSKDKSIKETKTDLLSLDVKEVTKDKIPYVNLTDCIKPYQFISNPIFLKNLTDVIDEVALNVIKPPEQTITPIEQSSTSSILTNVQQSPKSTSHQSNIPKTDPIRTMDISISKHLEISIIDRVTGDVESAKTDTTEDHELVNITKKPQIKGLKRLTRSSLGDKIKRVRGKRRKSTCQDSKPEEESPKVSRKSARLSNAACNVSYKNMFGSEEEEEVVDSLKGSKSRDRVEKKEETKYESTMDVYNFSEINEQTLSSDQATPSSEGGRRSTSSLKKRK